MEPDNTNQLAVMPQDRGIFSSAESFELSQRIGTAISKSTIIPDTYKNNLSNTMIAMELAGRIGASPLMVMQHLYIVHGKPSFSSTFLIASINQSGRFSPLRFIVDGSGDDYGCIAWAKDRDGERLESPRVTIGMAKKEGWYEKAGSKWKTMPEVMLRYRAATSFSRLYCPEITMGMQTREEVEDVDYQDVTHESAIPANIPPVQRITQSAAPWDVLEPKHATMPEPEPKPDPLGNPQHMQPEADLTPRESSRKASREWKKELTNEQSLGSDVEDLLK